MEGINYELPEELTIYTVAEVKPNMLEEIKELPEQKDLIFDCSQLKEIDAAGVQLILSVVRTSLQEEFDLFLNNASLEVERILSLLGVKEILVKEEISNG